METTAAAPPAEQLLPRIQELQDELDSLADETVRELADELVSSVVQMYGAGLERILAGLQAAGEEGARIAASLPDDPLVGALLLIHDLHPVPLEQRVRQALDSVSPYMESHGGSVELLSLQDGIARIHLRGSCSDCAASSVTLELAIKQALEEAAPDLEGLDVVGMAPQAVPPTGTALPMATNTGIELPMVQSVPAPAAPSWFELEPAPAPAEGALAAVSVAGRDLVVANVEGTLLAYADTCAACGGALRAGTMAQGALTCPGCARSFFLPRAGRSLDDDGLQLEPVPLLREGGRVRVALAA
ncbi:MAG TPA: NifU family protein [Solirubrobacteraceae bacterium]|nr:NifU family protein [Solirubrobacteraceae bacterium]